MKSFCFTILTLAVLAQAEDGKAKEKRGLADSPYLTASKGPIYTKSIQSLPSQQEYLSQGQGQQYYQADTQVPQYQTNSYAQPSVPSQQKFAYTAQPQPQHQPLQYSSAADVSSFSYSSPVVAYNNLGLLHQSSGKLASSQDSPVSYNTAPAQKLQYSSTQYSAASPKAQYSPSPKVQYVTSPKVQYSSAPRVQFSPSPKVQYTSSPSAYSGSPNYEELYQQIAQKAAYSTAGAEQPQEVSYQQDTVAQRERYVQAPAAAAYQTKAVTPQVSYAPSPPQYYSFQAPQAPQATPVYETSAQSAPKAYYNTKSATSESEVPQYYSFPGQARYTKSGITYA